MSTTKNAAFGIKKFSNILFTFTIFFTSCCFIEYQSRHFFFFDYNYAGQKAVLAFLLPFGVTVFHYIVNHDLLYLADRCALVCVISSILTAADCITFKFNFSVHKPLAVLHSAYGLETFFTVYALITLFTIINQKNGKLNNHYVLATRSFFCGATAVNAISFVIIFFLARVYNAEYLEPNFIPLNGEIGEILKRDNVFAVMRDIGNVFYFTGLTMTLCELAKRFKFFWAVILPILLSVSMELYQYAFVCGDPDVDDVILNTLGVIVGLLIYKLIIEKLKENELCWELLEQWMWK